MLYDGTLILIAMNLFIYSAAVHEKIFVVFMVTSLLYELLTLVLFKWGHPDMQQHPVVSTGTFSAFFKLEHTH